ncbi:PX-domain-containing protein [Viridothelium virens]|uniref:Endosomal/vacuolar adapter protein YPT35 n=1 Tax=Viridothelium virens TaxID=1048519 RepID=A0A6A6HAT4_VIRVR|nr:PX-domain-containing protein [Viridothelium virens]
MESVRHLHRRLSNPQGHEHAHANRGSNGATRDEIEAPPYWYAHQRSNSSASYTSTNLIPPPQITLEDHTEDGSEQCKSLWARHVSIDDFVIVSGNRAGVGAYVVWNCIVETLNGSKMTIMKRYSEFDDFRQKLVKTFPHAEAAMPPLPPKSIVSKFRPQFLEKRKAGLSYFLHCILLNPEFSGSPIVKEFLFS